MERFYEQTIFKYLRCEPEDHYFLLVRRIDLSLDILHAFSKTYILVNLQCYSINSHLDLLIMFVVCVVYVV